MKYARFALLLTALLGACTEAGPAGRGATSPSQLVGSTAPDFTTRDIDGKTARMSDWAGKGVILVSFFSTYCEPCKAEFPHLRALYDDKKKDGLVVLAVSLDGPETAGEVPAFAKRHSLNFPVLLDEDTQIARLYNPKKQAPYQILIDRQGRIAKAHEGFTPGDEVFLRKEVEKLLGK